jgi:hypothetical protein
MIEYYCYCYLVGNPKPEATGYTARASAATSGPGPTVVCSLPWILTKCVSNKHAISALPALDAMAWFYGAWVLPAFPAREYHGRSRPSWVPGRGPPKGGVITYAVGMVLAASNNALLLCSGEANGTAEKESAAADVAKEDDSRGPDSEKSSVGAGVC